jgi:hypothetical protein
MNYVLRSNHLYIYLYSLGSCINCPTQQILNTVNGSCYNPCPNSGCSSWKNDREGICSITGTTGTCTCADPDDNYCLCTDGGHAGEYGCVKQCTSSCTPSGGSKDCGDHGGC